MRRRSFTAEGAGRRKTPGDLLLCSCLRGEAWGGLIMAAPHRVRDDYDSFEDNPGEARMGFLEHLDELRSRLIRACIALVAGMAVSFVFALRLGDLLLAEILSSLPPRIVAHLQPAGRRLRVLPRPLADGRTHPGGAIHDVSSVALHRAWPAQEREASASCRFSPSPSPGLPPARSSAISCSSRA